MSEQFKNMDKLFRSKFENFEVAPPEHVWNNVQTAINTGNGRGGSIFNKGGIAGFSIFLVTIGVTLLYLLNNGFMIKGNDPISTENGFHQTENTMIPVFVSDSNTNPTSSAAVETENQNSEKIHNSKTDVTHFTKSQNPKRTRRNGRKAKRLVKSTKNGAIYIQPDLTSSPSTERNAHISLAVIDRINLNKPLAIQSESKLHIDQNQMNQANSLAGITNTHLGKVMNTDEMTRNFTSPNGKTKKRGRSKDDFLQNSNWQLGVFFTPEMISYNSDNQLKNYSYSVDIQGLYHSNSLILQSGLGMAQVTDKGNNIVDYHKYLGSYEDVYDITFDTTGVGLDPIFHTQTVLVYDSINSVKITPTKRKFTYLQVPFLAGYGKESKRFGWFIKAGPSLSLLINENKGQAASVSNQDQIIRIDDELPGRIQTNWQFIISGGTTFKLGKNINFSFEPMFRYYLQSAYKQNELNTRHPYSIGLRSGLLFNF